MASFQLPQSVASINIIDNFSAKYQIESRIEKNEGVEIFKGKDKATSIPVIIKKTPSENLIEENTNNFKKVIDNLVSVARIQNICHDNIIKYHCAGIDIETKDAYEVMEYCEEGDIKDVLKKRDWPELDEEEVLDIMYQTASGLDILHKLRISHRDIKPENIFVKKVNGKSIYKIGDYGSACNKNKMTTSTGTHAFKAPEMFLGDNYSDKADIWSLGVTFHYLLLQDYPFGCKNDEQVKINVTTKKYKYPQEKRKIEEEISKLITKMLDPNSKSRCSASEVVTSIRNIKDKLSKKKIENKVVLVKESTDLKYFKNDPSYYICSFCLKNYDNDDRKPYKPPCGHIQCKFCLDEYFNMVGKRACLRCLNPFNESDISLVQERIPPITVPNNMPFKVNNLITYKTFIINIPTSITFLDLANRSEFKIDLNNYYLICCWTVVQKQHYSNPISDFLIENKIDCDGIGIIQICRYYCQRRKILQLS